MIHEIHLEKDLIKRVMAIQAKILTPILFVFSSCYEKNLHILQSRTWLFNIGIENASFSHKLTIQPLRTEPKP